MSDDQGRSFVPAGCRVLMQFILTGGSFAVNDDVPGRVVMNQILSGLEVNDGLGYETQNCQQQVTASDPGDDCLMDAASER